MAGARSHLHICSAGLCVQSIFLLHSCHSVSGHVSEYIGSALLVHSAQQRGYFSFSPHICLLRFCGSDPWTPEGPCPVQSPPSATRGQPDRVLPPDDQPAKPLRWPADAERRSGCGSCSSCSSSTRLHQPCGWWAFFSNLNPVSNDQISILLNSFINPFSSQHVSHS